MFHSLYNRTSYRYVGNTKCSGTIILLVKLIQLYSFGCIFSAVKQFLAVTPQTCTPHNSFFIPCIQLSGVLHPRVQIVCKISEKQNVVKNPRINVPGHDLSIVAIAILQAANRFSLSSLEINTKLLYLNFSLFRSLFLFY